MNASHSTIPPMPDLHCPTWCESDHAADWEQHVLAGRDTRGIPSADGTISQRVPMPESQWLTLEYFEPLHQRMLDTITLNDSGEYARIDLQRGVENETDLYLDAGGVLSPSKARQVAAALLNAADRLDGLARE